ncbi:MAG: molybdenum cofactor biosynthesis protein MoaE [Gammaproteobacteria bacterium]|nr:molybdenum cofactor biosynthesis protein MoaE [Gammaproteobacteria bacterium]
MPYAEITADPLDPARLLARVGSPEDGAVLLFLGTVRNHADGRSVSGMQYEGYQEMALEVLRRIAEEASERFSTPNLAVTHRLGALEIGEVSVVVAVSSPHRAEAYGASRYVMEEIKRRLPVWKKEFYVEGAAEWVRGTVPPADGSPAPHSGAGDP